jgi:adenylosuccinate lyase
LDGKNVCATTQDIVDTGKMLQLKEAHQIFISELEEIAETDLGLGNITAYFKKIIIESFK